MAKQEIKFKVTLKELSIEFEGSREVGQALQTGVNRSLGTLLDMQRAATALPAGLPPPRPTLFDTHEPGDESGNGQPAIATPPVEKVKKQRKGNGSSLTTLLRDLKGEKFFTEPRTVEAVRERLKLKGHNHPDKTISSRLLGLTQKNELYRDQDGERFVYKDSPFHEGARTSVPPAEPAG